MKKVLSTLGNVFVALLLIFSVVMTAMVILGVRSEIGIPTLMGYSIMSVQTDSMEGPDGFNVGDLIVVKAVDEQEADKLEVGAVITFWRYMGQERYLETHRIVENTYETRFQNEVVDGVRIHGGVKYYVTKGDNTPAVDFVPDTGELEYKAPSQILAVWTGTAIPKVGAAFDFLKSQTGFMICIVVPVLLFFVYQLYVFIMTITRRQKEKALEEVSSKEEELKQKAIAEFLAQQQAAGNIPAPPADSSAAPPSEPQTADPEAEPAPAETTDAEPAQDEPASAVTTEEEPKSGKKSKKKNKKKNAEESKTEEAPAEESAEETAEESEEKSEEEPAEAPAAESGDEPKEEAAEETEEKPKEEPAEAPAGESGDEPKEEAAEETAEKPEEEPAEAPAGESGEEPKEEAAEEAKPADAAPEISEEEKNRIIQEYLAKQAQEQKSEE